MTLKLLENDVFSLTSHNALAQISTDALAILLHAATLHVTPIPETNRYWLLAPHPLFEFIKQHPDARNQTITLCIHDEPEMAIPVLIFLQPALAYQFSDIDLSQLARRYHAAKSLTQGHDRLTPSSIPTKSYLAKLAGVSSSAIRMSR